MKLNNRTIIFTIIAITPLLDSLNGFVSMYSPGILEQFVPSVRMLFMVFFMYAISKLNVRVFIGTALMSLFILMQSFIIPIINGGTTADGGSNLVLVIKLLYFFLLSTYLYQLKKNSEFTLNNFVPYIRFYAYSMPVLIIIPAYLGIGRVTYSSSEFGNSGFFIANNSSNIALISAMFVMLVLLINKIKIKDFIFIFIQMYALLVQGTKTGITLGLIILILLFIGLFFKNIFPPYKYSYIISTAIFLASLIELFLFSSKWYPIVVSKISEYIMPLIDRQTFLSRQIGSGVTSVLFSGRLDFLNNIMSFLKVNNNIITWIFGVGNSYILNTVGHIAEMDGFDIFFDFGISGLIITYGITFFVLKKTWILKNFYLKLSVLFVIMYSLLAGHVLVDILSSTGLSILLVLTSKDIVSTRHFKANIDKT